MLLSLLVACTTTELPTPYRSEVGLTGSGPAAVAPEATLRPGQPGITYELYVRSFQDSDADGIGDLEGVRQRLDHLDSLGVRTLWLMPIFPAFGPAGYDATDFGTITPEYGTEDDLVALLEEAHAMGIRVLLDVPLNHVHRSHRWFTAAESGDVAAQAHFRYAPAAEGEGWYPSQAGGAYFGWFGADMPDLDWHHADTRAAMLASLHHWLDLGVDGFRFDAVLMLDEGDEMELGSAESHELLGELLVELRARHPDRFFLAEASEWETERALGWLDRPDAPGCDAVLDFPRLDALVEAGNGHGVEDLVELVRVQVEAGGEVGMGAFTGSHDLPRLPARVPDPEARRALRVLQYLLPGSPVLYYGDELDLPDATTATGQDYAMRAPMPWSEASQAGFTDGTPWFTPDPAFAEGVNVEAQAADPDSMLSLTRALAALRAERGLDSASTLPMTSGDAALFQFERTGPAGTVRVEVNLGASPSGGLPAWGFRVQ